MRGRCCPPLALMCAYGRGNGLCLGSGDSCHYNLVGEVVSNAGVPLNLDLEQIIVIAEPYLDVLKVAFCIAGVNEVVGEGTNEGRQSCSGKTGGLHNPYIGAREYELVGCLVLGA